MANIDPSNSWLAILLSGLGTALLAAWLTHWIEGRKERIAAYDRTLAHMSLIEIDLTLNAAKTKADNTSYQTDSIRSFLNQGSVGGIDKPLLILLRKLLYVMDLHNQGAEPFRGDYSEKGRVNQLHRRCVDTANKILEIGASCQNEVPEKLKPKISEGIRLLTAEVRRLEREKRKLKPRWLGTK